MQNLFDAQNVNNAFLNKMSQRHAKCWQSDRDC